MSRLEFDLEPAGTGTVKLDGEDVSQSLRGFDVRCRVGEATEVTLYMAFGQEVSGVLDSTSVQVVSSPLIEATALDSEAREWDSTW